MTDAVCLDLDDRGLISVSGDDQVAFLQGLVSNDVEKVAADRAVHAAFLTPQGKYLFDFFMIALDGRILLDCEAARLADFMKRLRIYKLRSKVDLGDVSDAFQVLAVHGDGALSSLGLPDDPGAAAAVQGGVAYTDPRLARMGARVILPRGVDPTVLDLPAGDRDGYDALRIRLGVPDSSRDLVVDKTVLLEAGFDELNGVDWQKGCYMGQELTARTKYRGLVKRRLMPVAVEGPVPAPGTQVTADGRDAGEIRSAAGDVALAMIRLDKLDDATGLTAGAATVTPIKPDWAAF